jgi:hypothetical protein
MLQVSTRFVGMECLWECKNELRSRPIMILNEEWYGRGLYTNVVECQYICIDLSCECDRVASAPKKVHDVISIKQMR